MNPFLQLVLACAGFLGTHLISSAALRPRLVAAAGEKVYLGLYSLAAIATFGWMIFAYYRAPFAVIWYVPALRYVPLVVMPVALVLMVCGLLTRNPTAVGQERLLDAADAARGILRVTRHPLMWGIALWAAAHVMARGDAASAIFFGTFFVLALAGTAMSDRRKARTLGERWSRFAAATSHVPFAAILNGRSAFVPAEIGWAKPALGLAFYVVLFLLHPVLFGARPY